MEFWAFAEQKRPGKICLIPGQAAGCCLKSRGLKKKKPSSGWTVWNETGWLLSPKYTIITITFFNVKSEKDN
jgi:hypothetical protein